MKYRYGARFSKNGFTIGLLIYSLCSVLLLSFLVNHIDTNAFSIELPVDIDVMLFAGLLIALLIGSVFLLSLNKLNEFTLALPILLSSVGFYIQSPVFFIEAPKIISLIGVVASVIILINFFIKGNTFLIIGTAIISTLGLLFFVAVIYYFISNMISAADTSFIKILKSAIVDLFKNHYDLIMYIILYTFTASQLIKGIALSKGAIPEEYYAAKEKIVVKEPPKDASEKAPVSAIVSFVCGILSLFLYDTLTGISIVAVIAGCIALSKHKKAGKALAIIGIILGALYTFTLLVKLSGIY